jgi:3-deoxy-manno-octulosonate cytidylyltransferase (CMP-KDO synthetase)
MTAIARTAAIGIIPARYASKRFPGKALALIGGQPMIQHVWERARTAKHLRDVWVATDDERIANACEVFGARAIVTSSDHPSGTDRLAEAARGLADAVVVNIQGDEPLIEGFVIDAVVEALIAEPDVPMATVVHAAGPEAGDDPNRVKVALDRNGFALYFSRSPIPAPRSETKSSARPSYWQHVGLYAYRSAFLQDFVGLPRTPTEATEGLEQLRVLENGYRIRAAVVEGWSSISVDVPADIPKVESALASARSSD